jgi:hypothetical protein
MGVDGGGLGPFEAVRGLTVEAVLPPVVRVRQPLTDEALPDLAAATAEAMAPLRPRIRAGMRIALTAGSRGIRDKPAILRAAGEALRGWGAEPFIVPAMGSHGGAVVEGQVELLADLGVTEASMGMPIRATMETVVLARLDGGPPVHLDRNAAEADGILAINRIKAHTDFGAPVESGLAKIVAIGLGKRTGAEAIHSFGPARLGHWVPRVAAVIAGSGHLLGGLGIVEDGHDRAARIAFLEPSEIGGPAEAALLAEAKRLAPGLPFDAADVLVVDRLGKDRSGSGMDTNVIGRMMIQGTPEFERPRIATIVALDITDASHGNGVGIGLADFVPLRLIARLDLATMYTNALTSGLGGPQRAQLPMALPTDRDAIAAAVASCAPADPDRIRLARIRDTLDLGELWLSPALLDDLAGDPRIEVLGAPEPLRFEDGRLVG